MMKRTLFATLPAAAAMVGLISPGARGASAGEIIPPARTWHIVSRPANAPSLIYPGGIAVDASGNLYVADSGLDQIEKISPRGARLADFGSHGWRPGHFENPTQVGVDRWRHIYVLDSGNHRIQKLSSRGRPLAAFPLGPNSWSTDMAVDPWGHIYLSYYDHIVQLSARGRQLAVWPRRGESLAIDGAGYVYTVNSSEYDPVRRRYYPYIDKLSPAGEVVARFRYNHGWPGDIAVDGAGDVYVLISYDHRIDILSPSGRLIGRRQLQAGPYYAPAGGMAVDSTDTIYLADPQYRRIDRLSPEGIMTSFPHTRQAGRSRLNLPGGVAVDRRGNIYVADTWNDRVEKLSAAGAFLRAWGSHGRGPGQFERPTAIVITPQGNVVVADFGNSRLEMFSPAGRLLQAVHVPGPHYVYDYGPYFSFYGPGSISLALDQAGNYIVSDSAYRRVYRLSPGGRILAILTQWVTQRGSMPSGVAVDPTGNIYVADSGAAHIVKLSSTGRLLATWGRFGYVGPGRLNRPTGITIDSSGNLFVTDTGNHAVQELSADGRALHTWGTLGAGPGQFAAPQAVAIGGRGAVFVADTGNDRIQRLGF
jgi:DNA-binding beta-propeller fold protein YncE